MRKPTVIIAVVGLGVGAALGAAVGLSVGAAVGTAVGAALGAVVGAVSAVDEYDYGLDDESIESIAEDIPPGGGALLLVIEHTWAIPLRNALRASGGILIAQDFLSPELLLSLGALAAEA